MNNGINSYINSMNQATSTTTNSSGDTASLTSGAKNALALGTSNPGDVVTGEVVNISGKTVQIEMDNHKLITARLDNNMNISIGQSMAFEVRSNADSKITLSPLFTNTNMNPAMIKAINMASLPLSEQTINMTGTMMDNNLSIDRASMQNMFALINEFNEADPSTLVSMKAAGILIDETNIGQFEAYKNNEHQIMGAIEDIAKSLNEVMPELTMDGKSELLEVFNGMVDRNLTLQMGENVLYRLETVAEEIPEDTPKNQETVGPFGAAFAAENVQDKQLDEIPETAIREFIATNDLESELNNLLSSAEKEELARGLNEFGLPDSYLDNILSGQASPEQAMSHIQSAMELVKNDIGDKEALKHLLNSDGFKKLFADVMKKDFSLRPEEFSKESVKELYNKIVQDSQKILNILNAEGKGSSNAAAQTNNLQQNLSFMNDLNQMCQYVQLPIKLYDENAHGDLYVYTNKKKLSDPDGEVSALLHLEMTLLGTMDIHVKLKDKEHVNTHFYMEDEKMLDFVSEHLEELDARLSDRGYNNKSIASLKEKPGSEAITDNEVVANVLSLNKHKVMAKYSFDVRA